MSATMTGMVFERYPGSGGELLLALALADNAHEDGTHIFPSVKTMALKSRQSERTVQVQLKRMLDSGWLQLVREAIRGRSKGKGRGREYRINPEWVAGRWVSGAILAHVEQNPADSAPFYEQGDDVAGKNTENPADSAPFSPSAKKGAAGGVKGCSSAQISAEKGAAATAPEPSEKLNHQEKQPSFREARERDGAVEHSASTAAVVRSVGSSPPTLPATGDGLVPFPLDWQPDQVCRDLLAMRGRAMPDASVVDAFVGHYGHQLIAPRRLPTLFLAWVGRESGFQRSRPASATAAQAPPDHQLAAEAAWAEVHEANQRGFSTGQWRRTWSDARTASALQAIGGYGGRLAEIGPGNRHLIRKDFIAAFCDAANRERKAA